MQPLVGVVMGSKSDWETMKHCSATLDQLAIPHDVRVLSAHRTPDQALEYASTAESRGIKVLIAAAGGAVVPATVFSRASAPKASSMAVAVTIFWVEAPTSGVSGLWR